MSLPASPWTNRDPVIPKSPEHGSGVRSELLSQSRRRPSFFIKAGDLWQVLRVQTTPPTFHPLAIEHRHNGRSVNAEVRRQGVDLLARPVGGDQGVSLFMVESTLDPPKGRGCSARRAVDQFGPLRLKCDKRFPAVVVVVVQEVQDTIHYPHKCIGRSEASFSMLGGAPRGLDVPRKSRGPLRRTVHRAQGRSEQP